MKPKPAKPQTEKDVQRAIVAYLRARNWHVWILSQGYRRGGTRQTSGLSDLYCLHPMHGAMWVEVKQPGGKVRPAQMDFMAWHLVARLPAPPVWIVSSLDEMRSLLEP